MGVCPEEVPVGEGEGDEEEAGLRRAKSFSEVSTNVPLIGLLNRSHPETKVDKAKPRMEKIIL